MKNLIKNVIVCIAAVALVMVVTIKAGAQKAEFGLRFMPTFSSFDFQNSSGGTIKGQVTFGFGAGAFLGYNFNDHIGIQGELLYTSNTQKYKEVDVERKINLRYVNIPLLLSLNTGKTKALNLNVVAGPQIGLSAGSSIRTTSGNSINVPQPIVSVKKGDLGFAYGAGIDFGINESRTARLGLGYRGVVGLVDISDNSRSITTDSYYVLGRTHVKTNAIYIGLSILF